MKYFIDRANHDTYSAYTGKPPCEEAKLHKKYAVTGKHEKPNTYFYMWYVEINDINDLWNLMNKYGQIIIMPQIYKEYFGVDNRRKVPLWPLITIYDGYVE